MHTLALECILHVTIATEVETFIIVIDNLITCGTCFKLLNVLDAEVVTFTHEDMTTTIDKVETAEITSWFHIVS